MGRLFGTFYAIIYMGLSGITAVTNFGDTFLFSFLNFLCFPPETLVDIVGNEKPIRIDQVKIGDRFKATNKEITAVFHFFANGQSMVQFPNGLQVSTNHYIKHLQEFIPAGNHPDAKPCGPWTGGYERPLICLNSEDHTLPIQGYLFLDFDETEEGDSDTMKWVEKQLNGGLTQDKNHKKTLEYSPAISSETRVRMADRTIKPANQIKLGDSISTGNVVGVVRKKVKRASRPTQNEAVCEGACMWDPEASIWKRAADIFDSEELAQEHIFYGFVVTPTAQIELESGYRIRDYIEVHSPETEHIYAQKIAESGSHP
jgi:hypothetical protein